MTLEQRLAALEQEVESLKGAAGEALVPNYLSFSSTKGVAAEFPGGVILAERSGGYDPSAALSWQNAQGVTQEFIQGSVTAFQDHQLFLASEPDAQDRAQLLLTADAAGGAGSAAAILQLNDDGGGNFSETLLDSAGRSNFIQTPVGVPTQVRLQAGTFVSGVIAANASATIMIPLSVAWPGTHLAFIPAPAPSSAADVFVRRGGISDLDHGFVQVQNGTTAQTFTTSWISIGN